MDQPYPFGSNYTHFRLNVFSTQPSLEARSNPWTPFSDRTDLRMPLANDSRQYSAATERRVALPTSMISSLGVMGVHEEIDLGSRRPIQV